MSMRMLMNFDDVYDGKEEDDEDEDEKEKGEDQRNNQLDQNLESCCISFISLL